VKRLIEAPRILPFSPPSLGNIVHIPADNALALVGHEDGLLHSRRWAGRGVLARLSSWRGGVASVSGATGLASFSRRSTVSLSGAFGELRLGRDYVPTYRNESVFDPMGTVGVGENLIKSISRNIAMARGPGSAVAATWRWLMDKVRRPTPW
jgi:hypothetical protein